MVTSLNELKKNFLETKTGLSITSVGNDLNELEIRWLQSELTSTSRILSDLKQELFQTQSATTWSGYLQALGYSGSLESMKRSFYSNPASTLTLTNSFAPLTTLTTTELDRALPAVFSMDFTGLGDSEGCIFELGGTGTGGYIGFDSSGNFVARCGDGSARWPVNTAYILENGPTKPSGTGTLVVEFVAGTPIKVRAWWNSVPIGTPVDGAVNSFWGGTGNGGYLFALTPPAGESAANFTSYNTVSNLRYYQNQTIN